MQRPVAVERRKHWESQKEWAGTGEDAGGVAHWRLPLRGLGRSAPEYVGSKSCILVRFR